MSATAATHPPDVLAVGIRSASHADLGLVIDSWQSSLARGMRGSAIKRQRYRGNWREFDSLVKARVMALRGRGATIKIAFNPDSPDQIFGWACYERPVLHYVYVKEPFRGQGIARQLLADLADQSVLVCSAWTSTAAAIAKRHPRALRKVLPC